MKLRKKTLLISTVVLCSLTIILLYAANAIFLQGFSKMENSDMEKNLQRARNSLDSEIAAIDSMVSDWAYWDEAYNFIDTKDEGFINENLNDITFSIQKLNFIICLDNNGDIVYGQGFDLGTKSFTELPADLLQQFAVNGELFAMSKNDDGIHGITMLREGPVMLSAKPVLDTNKLKPAKGILIAGRFITNNEVEQMGCSSQVPLAIDTLETLSNEGDSDGLPNFIKKQSETAISGYTVINDLVNQPALVLRVDDSRDIYSQGKNTILYFIIVIIVSGILFTGINLWFIERNIIARVQHLVLEVITIGKIGDLTAKVKVSGNDELTQLGASINKMLSSLNLAQNALQTSEHINRVLLELLPDTLVSVDDKGVIIDFKVGRSRLAAVPSRMLPGRRLNECYSAEIADLFMENIHKALADRVQQVFSYEVNQGIQQEVRIDAVDDKKVFIIIRDFEISKKAGGIDDDIRSS